MSSHVIHERAPPGRHERKVWDCEAFRGNLRRLRPPDWRDLPVALPDWDSTQCFGGRRLVVQNATPELVRGHLHEAVLRAENRRPEERIVFLEAWNVWAEGNHVEPDEKWGSAWLEVIHEELTR